MPAKFAKGDSNVAVACRKIQMVLQQTADKTVNEKC